MHPWRFFSLELFLAPLGWAVREGVGPTWPLCSSSFFSFSLLLPTTLLLRGLLSAAFSSIAPHTHGTAFSRPVFVGEGEDCSPRTPLPS